MVTLINKFRDFVLEHDREMALVLDALKITGTFARAVRTGVSPMPRIDTNIERLKTLMKGFLDRSIPVPEWLAPYNKGRKAPATIPCHDELNRSHQAA